MSFAIAVQIQLFTEEAARGEPAAPAAATESPRASPSAAPKAAPRSDSSAPRRGENPDTAGAGTSASASAESRFRLLVGGGPAFGFGITPTAAVGARIFAGVQRGMWGAELGLEATLPGSYRKNGQGFDHHVELGSLAGCLLLRPFAGCLVSKVGRLSVTGYGVDQPHSPAGLLVQVGPRLALTQVFGDSWLGALRVEALATVAPWRVTLNQTEVWRLPPLTVTAGLDIAALFP
jgi:hypothetical protein